MSVENPHVAGDAPSTGDAPAISAGEQIRDLRQSIDNIDSVLVHALAERFKFTGMVGRLKSAEGMPASDTGREQRQVGRLRALAVEAHLDPAFAEHFLSTIVAEVIHNHELIAIEGAMQ
jgi:chorismate mutase